MDETTLYRKRKRPAEAFLLSAVYGAASVSVMLLCGMIGYLFFRGAGAVSWRFLTTVTDVAKKTSGIAGNMINTLYIAALTLLAAIPLGVGAAVYLSEYATPGRLVNLIVFTTETLSGIPSVLFGLFGMGFFGETLGLGYSLLTGALTLALMVLPLIVRNTQEALRAVPEGYRSGALGLGASRFYMIRTVLLPAAMPGILTGVLLSVGRIVGESAALLFTAGSDGHLPKPGGSAFGTIRSLGEKMLESGGTLAVELYLQVQNGRYETAFGIGCVLIAAAFGLNLLVKLAAVRLRNRA